MPFDSLTRKTLEEIKSKISEHIAGTAAASSLEIEGNKLIGNDYIYYLVHGRRPGKFPPVDAMQSYVRDKLGLSAKEANQAAFLIGRKISEEGTKAFTDSSKRLPLDEIIEKELDNLYNKLGDEAKAEALTFLEK